MAFLFGSVAADGFVSRTTAILLTSTVVIISMHIVRFVLNQQALAEAGETTRRHLDANFADRAAGQRRFCYDRCVVD
jgi:hypothetical protein